MNMNHTSAHARVFDGVRTARIRSFDESLLTVGGEREHCIFHAVPAVALWVHADTGAVSPLCPEHLEASLRRYRDETDTNPPAVVPVRRRTE